MVSLSYLPVDIVIFHRTLILIWFIRSWQLLLMRPWAWMKYPSELWYLVEGMPCFIQYHCFRHSNSSPNIPLRPPPPLLSSGSGVMILFLVQSYASQVHCCWICFNMARDGCYSGLILSKGTSIEVCGFDSDFCMCLGMCISIRSI